MSPNRTSLRPKYR